MSCKMLDYWMLSRNIWKPPKAGKKHKKHAKTCPNSACRTPSVEGMRSNRQQRLTTPRSAPAIADRTDRSIRSAPQHHPGKSRSSARLHLWQSPSEESEPGNVEMTKMRLPRLRNPNRNWICLNHNWVLSFDQKIPKSWPAGLYIQLRMFQRMFQSVRNPRWCGDVGYRSSNGRWILTCNMTCNMTYPHIRWHMGISVSSWGCPGYHHPFEWDFPL